MSFDGIVTGAVARELRRALVGGKIEKIYQPEADEIICSIHAGRERYRLYLSSNSSHARMHLTQEATVNPQNPPSFCMLLRKHIQGGRINDILQKDSERIVEITVDTVNELGFTVNKKLIVEIMGKHSNIILVDLHTDRIIDSIKRISIDVNRYRQLLPGLPYIYPPNRGKRSLFQLTKEDMEPILTGYPSAAKALVEGIEGISPTLADELIRQTLSGALPPSGALEEPRCTSISPDLMFQVLHRMAEQLETMTFNPQVYLDENETPVDFHVFPLEALDECCHSLPFSTAGEAAAYFYAHKTSSNRIHQKSSDLERTLNVHLDKLYLKKQRLLEDLQRAENADHYRLCGELLTAAIPLVKPGANSAQVPNYYDNSTLNIPLDPRFSAADNAQRYYKKYAKAKTAVKEKNVQLEENEQEIQYLESCLTFIQSAASFEEIEAIRLELVEGGYLKRRKKNGPKPQKDKPAPHSFTTADGFRILVGRNNKENDYLTLKLANKQDLWFHTKDIPGSHVILFTEGRAISETAVLEAAGLAAYYSKGQQSENVPVDYTTVRHVKKPSGAKPGMVIFTDNKTIYVTPKLLT